MITWRRAVAGLGVAVLLAASIAAGMALWDTSVPGDLVVPELDAGDHFSEGLLSEAAGYQRFIDAVDLLAVLAMLAGLALYAAVGERFTHESAAGRIGTGMLLGMLGLAFVWLAQLPFGFAKHWWERRHDVTDTAYVDWLLNAWASAGGKFLFSWDTSPLSSPTTSPTASAWPCSSSSR